MENNETGLPERKELNEAIAKYLTFRGYPKIWNIILKEYPVSHGKEILSKLLKIQETLELVLISNDEIDRIKEIWSEDTLTIANRTLVRYASFKKRDKI